MMAGATIGPPISKKIYFTEIAFAKGSYFYILGFLFRLLLKEAEVFKIGLGYY